MALLVTASTGTWTRAALAFAACLFLAALWVRGVEGRAGVRPDDVVHDPANGPAPLDEPAQLLSPGGWIRLPELDERIALEFRTPWQESQAALYTLEGCPDLVAWMDGSDGLALERNLAVLRAGSEIEALAALTLVFRLARATKWKPGLLARKQHAVRLGGLLEDWLLAWSEAGAESAQLYEPTLRATAFYGHVMRVAYQAPLVGRDDASLERARATVDRLVGAAGDRTRLGRAVQERFPRAIALLEGSDDLCRGFSEECRALYPDLDGECEE